MSPDILLTISYDIPGQPGWSSWKVPVSATLKKTGSELDYYQVLDNPPVAPFIMLGGTDCQHFVPVCDDI